MMRDINSVDTGLLLQVVLQYLQQFGIEQIRMLWQLSVQDPVDQFQFLQRVLRDIAHRRLFLATTGIEAGRQLAQIALTEQKTQHVPFDDFQTARVRRAQTVFVEDGGETLQPLLPALFGNIFINPQAQLTRVGWCFQTFGLLFQYFAKNLTQFVRSP